MTGEVMKARLIDEAVRVSVLTASAVTCFTLVGLP